MSLRLAVLELRDRLKVLEAWADVLVESVKTLDKVLKARVQVLVESVKTSDSDPGCKRVHCLIDEVDTSAQDALCLLHGVREAVRKAVRAKYRLDRIREVLTKCQHGLNRLRRKQETAKLRNGELLAKLTDLGDRLTREKNGHSKQLKEWADHAVTVLRELQTVWRQTDAAMNSCWRELAGGAGGRVEIQNLVVGRQIIGGRRKRS